MQLATIDAFYKNPSLVWEWYQERLANVLTAKPNPGHLAIAELERHKEVIVLTQNIDGLHQRAGSKIVLELHGSLVRIKCTVCNFIDQFSIPFEILQISARVFIFSFPNVNEDVLYFYHR